MRLSTRTPRRVAIAGLALVTAATLTACSSDSEGNASESSTGASSESASVSTEAPKAPVAERILAEAPPADPTDQGQFRHGGPFASVPLGESGVAKRDLDDALAHGQRLGYNGRGDAHQSAGPRQGLCRRAARLDAPAVGDGSRPSITFARVRTDHDWRAGGYG